jgi:hypothetical protein
MHVKASCSGGAMQQHCYQMMVMKFGTGSTCNSKLSGTACIS